MPQKSENFKMIIKIFQNLDANQKIIIHTRIVCVSNFIQLARSKNTLPTQLKCINRNHRQYQKRHVEAAAAAAVCELIREEKKLI